MNQVRRLQRFLAATLTLALLPAVSTADELVVEITQGAEAALPIAIADFGGDDAPEDLAAIIRANLLRSGQFDPLPPEEFVNNPTRSDEINYGNWRAVGVDNLVVGRVDAEGDEYRVRYELTDVYGGSRMTGSSYTVGEPSLRTVAHVISDTIYEELLGRPGAFNTMIAYVAIDDSGDEREYSLVVADADGHNPQAILTTSTPLLSPAWSPDRERLAYVSFEGRRTSIYVQEVASGERERIARFQGLNSAPDWSPDGEHLTLTRSRDGQTDIYSLDVESGETTRLTEHYGIDTEAVWGPNGEQIYFTSDRGGSPQIYRMNADGGDVERVTFEGDYNASPALSPDGEELAMVHREDGDYRIAVQEVEGGQFRVLSQGPQDESPTFAPNGAMVLYATRQDGRGVLGTVSLFGEARNVMATGEQELREPAWSPN